MKKLLLALFTIGLILGSFDDADARRRGGGSFRSSRSSYRSSGKSSSSRSRGKFSSSSKRGKFSSRRSKADRAAYKKAASKGTAFKSKSAATKHFKKKYASKYKTKFDSKPKTRPDYIPKTYEKGGKTYNITYNPQHGGYGYMGSDGWHAYNVMRDATMMSMLMRNNGYYYGPQPMATTTMPTGFKIFLTILFVGFVGVIIFAACKAP